MIYTVEDILGMDQRELAELMNSHPFDRLGCDGDGFCMVLEPVDGDVFMHMFVPVDIDVVREFYIRHLCGHTFNQDFDI